MSWRRQLHQKRRARMIDELTEQDGLRFMVYVYENGARFVAWAAGDHRSIHQTEAEGPDPANALRALADAIDANEAHYVGV